MEITKDNSVLLVIDVQEKLMEKIFNRDEVVANTCKILDVFKAIGLPVVWTEQYPKGLGPTVHEVVTRLEGAPRAEKVTFDCFRTESFRKAIDATGRKNVIVAGVEAQICVMQTVKGSSGGSGFYMLADATR